MFITGLYEYEAVAAIVANAKTIQNKISVSERCWFIEDCGELITSLYRLKEVEIFHIRQH